MTTEATLVRCTVPACTSTLYYAKGMCKSHYEASLRKKDTRVCTVAGCGKKYWKKGLCATHGHRLDNYGSTDTPPGRLPEPPVGEKNCTRCKRVLPVSEFRKKTSGRYKDRTNSSGYDSMCLACTKAHRAEDRKAHPEREKYRHLKHSFGLTKADYLRMDAAQDHRCQVCKRTLDEITHKKNSKRFCADHDHTTGKVRGLLCAECNQGLGHFADSLDRLKSAILYLQAHGEPTI